jgi:serine/threonine protein phosphatase PrpC
MASDFLKDKMVNELLREKRSDMEALLNQIYQRIDAELVAKLKDATDNSGSSALLCIVNQNLLYVANVGTSFAFGRSSKDGSIIKLNNQHNCDNPAEYARVTSAGGRVFQTKVSLRSSPKKFIEGPMRVHPYGLTVTRTMGHF